MSATEFWTSESIVAALHEWTHEHGGQPSAIDWRYADYGHPCLSTVVERFGSWSAGLMAAGFTPKKRWRKLA